MGFNDTATYVRANGPGDVQAALTPILAGYGYELSQHGPFPFFPSYTPLAETNSLELWMENAGGKFLRLYSSHSGIFAAHEGDYVPVLQRLSAALGADAFEVCVNDGDSLCVLETDGTQSRLTGCHSYVLDEIYERTGDLILTPGEIYPWRGALFPYQSIEVEAAIIPELIGYDFGSDLQIAITDFETSVFGRELPSYTDFEIPSSGASKKEVFSYRRSG